MTSVSMSNSRPTVSNKRLKLIRTAFDLWEHQKDHAEYEAICELFSLYKEILLSIDDSDSTDKERAWKEKYHLAGIKAHQLFQDLASKGVYVVFNKRLLKNRIGTSKYGPQELPFFLHLDVVEDLLKFILLGTPR